MKSQSMGSVVQTMEMNRMPLHGKPCSPSSYLPRALLVWEMIFWNRWLTKLPPLSFVVDTIVEFSLMLLSLQQSSINSNTSLMVISDKLVN